MSNDYIVRPMGADPRTSITITDAEIIYKNGLIGSSVKRVPLQDARVEYSSLIKGGELVVKDHGQEVFRVGGILSPGKFYEEFDRRKRGEKAPENEHINIADLKHEVLSSDDVKISRRLKEKCDILFVNQHRKSGGRYSRRKNVILPDAGTKMQVDEFMYNLNPFYALGVHYSPKEGTYHLTRYKRKPGGLQEDFQYAYAISEQEIEDYMLDEIKASKKLTPFLIVTGGIITAAFLAASAAFGDELPLENLHLNTNSSEFSETLEL
ncbi:MAG: hypothetical protein ACLFR0_00835 [Alphaproteobacteria bacterium]